MPQITRETVVTAPLRFVYDAWTQFETYPQFLEGVVDVEQVEAKRLRWRARSSTGLDDAGVEHEWDVRLVEQAPDDRILWEADFGPVRSGAVLLDAVTEGRTRVRLEMDIEAALNNETDLAFRAERDLQSFKDYIEARVQQISGWQSGVSEEAPPLAG